MNPDSPEPLTPLLTAAARFGVELSPEAVGRLETYRDLLLIWNRRINLISRKDTGRIVSYHFLDSLTAAPLIPERASVCDLGSGAGLPGIPLKIARADIVMTLIEATRKKALFLDEAVRQLRLENTTVINARAEEITEGREKGEGRREKFDVVLCRLLGKVGEVAPIAGRLLNPAGRIIFYKSDLGNPKSKIQNPKSFDTESCPRLTLETELKQAQSVLDRLRLAVHEIRDYRFAFTRRLVVVTRSAG